MNQTQVNEFLLCLSRIDDFNYLALHNKIHNSVNRTKDIEHDHDHEHDLDHDHDHDHSLLIAKITAMIVLFFASAICGSIPFLLNIFFKFTDKHPNAGSANVVKCLLYFGGGVLLCTTFIHLLPEVQETVDQLEECEIIAHLTFPLAAMLMCAGFFLMFFIEEMLHSYIHRNQMKLNGEAEAVTAFERGHSVRNSYLVRGKTATLEGNTQFNSVGTSSTSIANESTSAISLISDENLKYAEKNKSACQHDHDDREQNHQHQHHHQHLHQQNKHPHNHSHNNGHSHLTTANGDGSAITSSLRGLFIVLALSLHELFEGMAIGLEDSSSAVWFMFGAVSAHKLVLAFCVGVELIVAKTRTSLAFVYVFTFAVVSPIGIGIGILISDNEDHATSPGLISVILQGLACGTLLYVVFFEIISKNHGGLLAYFSLLLGFLLMFGMQQLGVREHGHSHGSCSGHEHVHDHEHIGSILANHHVPVGNIHEHYSNNIVLNESTDQSFDQKLQQLRHVAKALFDKKVIEN